MSKKVLIASDSTTDLSAELIEKYPHCKCWCENGEVNSEFIKYKEGAFHIIYISRKKGNNHRFVSFFVL